VTPHDFDHEVEPRDILAGPDIGFSIIVVAINVLVRLRGIERRHPLGYTEPNHPLKRGLLEANEESAPDIFAELQSEWRDQVRVGRWH
jgi:hypothetical protein